MPREKPTFRLELEQLRAYFPGRNVLSKKDIMDYTGKKEFWLNSHGFKGRGDLTLVQVAAILTDLL